MDVARRGEACDVAGAIRAASGFDQIVAAEAGLYIYDFSVSRLVPSMARVCGTRSHRGAGSLTSV
jgi:hypothetical protein